jgi:hypothetical protein
VKKIKKKYKKKKYYGQGGIGMSASSVMTPSVAFLNSWHLHNLIFRVEAEILFLSF